ncbi:hypothetical protein CUU95_18440 [Vreelandella alkaliphila]|uniref:hypothetical protein n=1 Tax=Vreelandella alkaliphila TaxID=272774 RepID=UPI000EA04ABF|nr:hypothetical protein [Halomonas alkaliphila]AYF35611.1 hypothetical protein CUU95_18120 [Halomonas alkaliphila]AYF35670.1 hypothetical protein CUU95_18440 [Halomonas alkaliphila]
MSITGGAAMLQVVCDQQQPLRSLEMAIHVKLKGGPWNGVELELAQETDVIVMPESGEETFLYGPVAHVSEYRYRFDTRLESGELIYRIAS